MIYLTWSDYNSRSEYIAHYFNLKEVYFGYLRTKKRSPILAFIRYPVLMIHTFIYLTFNMPEIVFTVNLPIFEPLVVMFWAKLFRKKYIIDNHSALFERRQYSWTLSFLKPVFKMATLSIVTNDNYKNLIKNWGGNSEVLPALIIPKILIDEVKQPYLVDEYKVTAVTSFDVDEPIDEILKAAQYLPKFNFNFTGSVKNLDSKYLTKKPDNVTFTDFIPRSEFINLVSTSLCAVVLTNEDNTMQRGAYEAMSLTTPIITSNFQILRNNFYKGSIIIDNNYFSIIDAIKRINANYSKFKREIENLKQENWKKLSDKINLIKEKYLKYEV